MLRLLSKGWKQSGIQFRYGFSELQKFSDSFLNGSNAQYLENLFDQWYKDPNSVGQSWDQYFRQVADRTEFKYESSSGGVGSKISNLYHLQQVFHDYLRVRKLIDLYRMRGHEKAKIDPLELNSITGKRSGQSPVDVLQFFKEEELDQEFYVYDSQSYGIDSNQEKQFWKLRDLVGYLEKVYCGKVSYEYMHTSKPERDWIMAHISNYENYVPEREQRMKTFSRLAQEYSFSMFLQKKFTTSKRFGIEGLDSMISGLWQLVDVAAQEGAEHIAFGMAHRGRLSTLYNVFQKSAEEIMMEFQDLTSYVEPEEAYSSSGDVKYHLGCIHNVMYGDKRLRLEMLPNPSHLEAVDPLVYGKVRAIQDYLNDKNHEKSFGVLIHGDAALSGQGIVYESLNMAELEGYKSGGIVHIVANNQIGFTTLPKDSRSGLYCTDLAYTIQAPIIHVNADEPDLVDRVFTLAIQFRNKFKKDIFVDLVGYRRYGHNEQDQPRFTQPQIYDKIQNHKPVFQLYSQKLIADGTITQQYLDTILKENEQALEIAYQKSRKMDYDLKDWQPLPWEMIKVPYLWGAIKDTGVPSHVIQDIGAKINTIPKEFNCHPQVRKFYEDRLQWIMQDQGIDFATAEALAFGTLMHEGFSIRLSGEDVQRATFSHRHAVIHDQKDPKGKPYIPLHNISPNFQAYNSLLSEYGVMGFDYGYSITNPNCLVCWEAQFGDFANGAQIIIDNYITSAEVKWDVDCGLVLLLPNGMDGQGPEHSQARIERYLQLSDDDPSVFEKKLGVRLTRQIRNSNMQIVQCTTPANYFHALRRQLRRDFRKPLIAFTSKKLLRLQQAKSKLNQLTGRFNRVYGEAFPETLLPPDQIKRVIICSGQVYYDLLKRRETIKANNVAILRIEQLAPFPYEFLQDQIAQYSNAKFMWAQEEHQNYGAWTFVNPRILKVLQKTHSIHHHTLSYVGRKPSGATATGFPKVHEFELNQLLTKAFEDV